MIFNLMKPIPIAEPTMYLYGHEAEKTVTYNGVELPELPVWDKTAYPYATIQITYGGYICTLIFSSVPLAYKHERMGATLTYHHCLYATETEWSAIGYSCASYDKPDDWEGTPWVEEELSGYGTSVTSSMNQSGIWANYDVTNFDDGSLYQVATDPVVTYENADVTINGVGYVGAVLPKLPSWDKEQYPYAYISKSVTSGYYLRCFAVAMVLNASGSSMTTPTEEGVAHCSFYANSSASTWSTLDPSVWAGGNTFKLPIWANTDIFHADGTLYLSASEPVPVYE